MSKDTVPEIGSQQIDALLSYLPLFVSPGYKFGEWVSKEGHFPYFSYNPEVMKFIQTLYEQNILVQFDWMGWEEGERYASEPEALEAADILTLRKLLTMHLRADRFTEGHLASVLESGHITAILCRLKEIRDQMS
jgi:hypothetical protein